MRRPPVAPLAVTWLLGLVATATLASAADNRDPLAQARRLYNERQFQAAISAAERARLAPMYADSADLIAARAYLERYRESAASDDLTNARERLRRLNPQRFGVRERAEFIVGLGETLYFDGSYGAAADMFATVLETRGALTGEARERVLDWWATAFDRDATARPEAERREVYPRIRAHMADELAANPNSATAAYWLAAAARAQGDLQGAWDAAEAGWVRATLAADRGAALRADLDRLVLRAIIPERARMLAQSADMLRLEWEKFKDRWKTN
jgi:hypothetical protein